MKADRLAIAGSFCWNESCPSYGKVDSGNIVRYGRTAKGTPRLKCKTCGRVFVENKGTVLYGLHHDLKMSWNAWLCLVKGTAWLLSIESKG